MKDPPFCLTHPSSQVEEGCLQVELGQGKSQGGQVNLGRLQGGRCACRRSSTQRGPEGILTVGCVKPVT